MTNHRPEPPVSGTECDVAIGFLNYLRETIIWKVEELTEAQARQTLPTSSMSIIAMIQHLQFVERWWFRHVFAGEACEFPWTEHDPDADWRVDERDTVADVVARYRQEVALSNHIVSDASLDNLAARPRESMQGLQLRWIVFHMIEETGRHCGHADLIRESIDGATGE